MDLTKCYNKEIGYNCCSTAGSNLGLKLSEETKRKIGDFWRGKPKPKEHVLKYIEVQTKINGKPVVQYDSKMNFIAEYKSISEASRQTKLSIACISKQCSELKGQKRPRKFIFRYKDIV